MYTKGGGKAKLNLLFMEKLFGISFPLRERDNRFQRGKHLQNVYNIYNLHFLKAFIILESILMI